MSASKKGNSKPVQAAPTPKVRMSPWRASTGIMPPARPRSMPSALKKRMAKAVSPAVAFRRFG